MAKSKIDILAIASYGGHFTQLKMLNSAFGERLITYVTTQSVSETLKIADCNKGQPLKIILCTIQLIKIILKNKPKCILSTGAAPGAIGLFIGRMLGIKTIWIDSIANYKQLSLSGRLVSKFATVTLTQWKHLEGKKIGYIGGLL